MRTAIATLLTFIAAPAIAGVPQILAATPASVELSTWCRAIDDGACRQAAADAAQARCQAAGRNARYARGTLIERDFVRGEKALFVYDCVR